MALRVGEEDLRDRLTACLHVDRWVDDLVARAPYETVADLLDAAREAATPLASAEIHQALAAHPRIGERAPGHGAAQQLSAAEQSTSASTDPSLADELAAGNRAYEERFGRIFLIRAAGRTRPEILAELRWRLLLDPQTEAEVVGEELREIALLRIGQLFRDEDQPSEQEPKR